MLEMYPAGQFSRYVSQRDLRQLADSILGYPCELVPDGAFLSEAFFTGVIWPLEDRGCRHVGSHVVQLIGPHFCPTHAPRIAGGLAIERCPLSSETDSIGRWRLGRKFLGFRHRSLLIAFAWLQAEALNQGLCHLINHRTPRSGLILSE
jgi:hypothetical protein